MPRGSAEAPADRPRLDSAAGGVGGALIQLAKLRGCEVVGVVGASAKVESARRLGADHVIDKSTRSLWREARRHAPDGYDVILDANGASTLGASYAHLRRAGKLVVYCFHSMLPRTGGEPSKSVLAFNPSYLFERRYRVRQDDRQAGAGAVA